MLSIDIHGIKSSVYPLLEENFWLLILAQTKVLSEYLLSDYRECNSFYNTASKVVCNLDNSIPMQFKPIGEIRLSKSSGGACPRHLMEEFEGSLRKEIQKKNLPGPNN